MTEFLAIGDAAGQVTLMEVSKLFSEKAVDEEKMVLDIFKNEINRQEYMEMRYKALDEIQNKPDESTIDEDKEEDGINQYMDESFKQEKLKLLQDLGLIQIEEEKEEKGEE